MIDRTQEPTVLGTGTHRQELKFGEWLRGIHASESNPHRDGMYVRTIRRAGNLNPGVYYEVTDGNGKFWQYPAQSVERLATPPAAQVQGEAVGEVFGPKGLSTMVALSRPLPPGTKLYTHPAADAIGAVRMNQPAGGEAVAEVGPGWTLRFVGSTPIAELCRQHPELRIGTKLYTHPAGDAPDLLDALQLVVDTAENGGWPSAVLVIAKAAIAQAVGHNPQ